MPAHLISPATKLAVLICSVIRIHPESSFFGFDRSSTTRTYLFEATPHMPEQMKFLKELAHSDAEVPDGIFLTHAHIGHYTGLMYLGKEAMNAKEVPVYVMPRMKTFLEENGPWSQLVSQGQY